MQGQDPEYSIYGSKNMFTSNVTNMFTRNWGQHWGGYPLNGYLEKGEDYSKIDF